MSSASASGDGQNRIHVSQLSIGQLSQLRQQLEQEIDLFTRSLQQLKLAEGKFQESLNNVQKMMPNGGDAVNKPMLVPLSSSMYVPGKISDTEKVTVEIGTGYYVKMPLDKATEYFQRKIAFVNQQMNKVQEAGNDKVKIRGVVEEAFQAKIQAQMQTTGGKSVATAS